MYRNIKSAHQKLQSPFSRKVWNGSYNTIKLTARLWSQKNPKSKVTTQTRRFWKVTQLVWWKPINGMQTFPLTTNKVKSKGHTLINIFVNNPPYKDRGLTVYKSGEAITIITQTIKVMKTVYHKYIKTSAREGYAPPVCKRAQVRGLKESRLTIRGNEDQGIVSCEEV